MTEKLIKLCVNPVSRKPVAICNRVAESDKPEEMPCCMCSSAWYLDVEVLKNWYELLKREGINSKHMAREEIKKILKEVGKS